MDEPTTGMDPKSRRQVWGMIEELKLGRVIIMTTHSMEEAEMLADRVGIMARGTLKCYGTPLYLKNNFGKGYRLSIMTEIDHFEQGRDVILSWLPQATLATRSGGQMIFSLQQCNIDEIVRTIEFLENLNVNDNLFLDWGISQSGLEEVFLSVTGHDDAHKSNVIQYNDNE
jgi:ABC-type multidrug transport system ATPase subunit